MRHGRSKRRGINRINHEASADRSLCCSSLAINLGKLSGNLPAMWFSSPSSLSELIPIVKAPEGVVDVIFVHGLDGDAHATWRFTESSSWHTWIASTYPTANVWSLRYRVRSTNWRAGSMPLADRASNILHLLKLELRLNRPIVFVCHSYGGLLVKQMLRSARDFPRGFGDFATSTKGICFFATPHSGSAIPGYINALRPVLRTSAAVRELARNDPNMRNLNLWFRNHRKQKRLGYQFF